MKLRLSNVTRFFIARGLSHVYVWAVIAIPYLQYRGLEIEQAYAVISFYALCIVLLEYPTGVIGDYFGHKTSQIIGQLVSVIAFVLVAQDAAIGVYYVAMLLNAMGNSFVSGSDIATLNNISKNFKEDLPKMKSLCSFILFIVSVVGGYLADFSFELTLYASAVAYILSALTYITVHEDSSISHKNRSKGNIFATASDGLKHVKSDRSLVALLLFFSVFGAFLGIFKNIFGSFEDVFELNVTWIGWLVGLGMLTRTVGTRFTNKFEKIKLTYLLGVVVLGVSLASLDFHVLIPITMLLVTNFFIGVVNTRLTLDVNAKLLDNTRASIMSLSSLLRGLFSSGYLYLFGIIVTQFSFAFMMILSACMLAFVSVVYVSVNTRFEE